MKATIVLETEGSKDDLRWIADKVQKLVDDTEFGVEMVYMEEQE